MKKQLFFPLIILLFLFLGTTLVVLYGKGYRFNFEKGRPDFNGTGLLVATSLPDGAQVFINGHLTTATDNTINLAPKSYDVKIIKEGYFPWEKNLIVKNEVVTKAEALLFPTTPKLESITNTGIENPILDPTGTKLAFTVASQSAVKKRGIYVLDISSRPILTLQSSSNQIADDTLYVFSKAQLAWSPDGAQLMATLSGQSTFLLDARNFNQTPQDVTETMSAVNSNWQKLQEEKRKAQMDTLKTKLREVVVENFSILAWSLDETKILYKASQDNVLPVVIEPRLIGANTVPEQRIIKKDSIYVYDTKEDHNYRILDSLSSSSKALNWFPDSKHLVYVHDQKVSIMEYDATNQTTVYAGPFVDSFVFPWPDGSKIVILTNLGNLNIAPNLYTIGLK
ncbi:MAG: hypothetical protein CO135_02825 [Candidatus Levybacteria bacterium CG_4_9_14_3_um_filter_35_16]|nr:MAG: hypothetical protein CO135_02825 [Candidatus Levybacteria bacterium CG_4_9_14_3_um_filter_35_16]PJC54363.1 MAG: hypothetical protein CO028_02840 [Candidatus Levybacteria bacterium CG_4_9_14_0_2_um_filter_35_21]